MTGRSTWELAADRLARLLEIGEDHELPQGEREVDALTGELLRRRLAGPLPFESAAATALDVVLRSSAGPASPAGGPAPPAARSMGQVLLDPNTNLALLGRIKSWGKKLADRERASTSRRCEHAIGLTVYYAAIAAALAFHGEKVTDYSFAELDRSFRMLMDKPWLPPEMSQLLARAGRICQEGQK
jgi:hypothetical protein